MEVLSLEALKYDYKQNSINISVKGKLKKNGDWWKDYSTDDFVTNLILEGYKLPFYETPPDAWIKNNKSALDNPDFVTEAIQDLLACGSARECENKPKVVNALTVAINPNKKRLVLDLSRSINPYLWREKSKYEGIPILLYYLGQGKFLFTFDLKNGYHHIDIFHLHQEYLGFEWKGKFYCFTVLPFGLSTTGSVFTRVLKVLVKKWRSMGIQLVLYLDDGIGICDSFSSCLETIKVIRDDLRSAGFVVNEEKSLWEPQQVAKWLGFVFDTNNMTISVPEKKLENLVNSIEVLIKKNSVSARLLAQVIGKIVAMQHAFGDLVFLMTKFCQIQICQAITWDCKLLLGNLQVDELMFWHQNVRKLKPMSFSSNNEYSTIVYSDASNSAAASYILDMNSTEMVYYWSKLESEQSSTWREVKAIHVALLTYANMLEGNNVRWFTDCKNVESIARRGSMVPCLNGLALSIFQLCIQHNIKLKVEWIPREMNEQADYLSKVSDFDDWSINDVIFQFAQGRWGQFTCDLFADHRNNKCEKFYSKFWCPGSAGMNAFAQCWTHEFAWVVPPPDKVLETLRKMKSDKAKGVLICPKWLSASFWPILCPNGEYLWQAKDYIEYERPSNLFVAGSQKDSIFAAERFNSNVLMMLINFS